MTDQETDLHAKLRALVGRPTLWGLAVDGDLLFFHGLEQGGLGAGWGPVELVDQDHVGEHRPGPELPCAGVRRNHRHARDVGWQQVGVPLDARQFGAQGDGERPGEHGFAHPRYILNEEVTAGQHRHHGSSESVVGPEEHLRQVGDQLEFLIKAKEFVARQSR